MELPRFVALESCINNRYLRYVNEDLQLHGFLQFSGKKVLSPFTKFEVEKAKSGNGLVHIRCCYNNKYWRRLSQNYGWIVVEADEPEEDRSKWSCTLFDPVCVDGNAQTVQFRHGQLDHYIYMVNEDYSSSPSRPKPVSCLFAGPTPNNNDVFKFIDLDSRFPLPNFVRLKADNEFYVDPETPLNDGQHYLKGAIPESEKLDPIVANQVITNDDGRVCLKSHSTGKYWKRWVNNTNNWILADSADASNNDPDLLFWPVRMKYDTNVVALKNLGNNKFCIRHTAEGIRHCLAAFSANYERAYLNVEELVSSRKIQNVNFWVMDARIYSTTVVPKAVGEAANWTQEPKTMDVLLSYIENRSSTWNSSVSLKVYSNTRIQTRVPVIEEGKIAIPSSHINEEYQWGSARVTRSRKEVVYEVTVKAMTMVIVTLEATMGSCDIPFSYSQHDTLTNYGDNVTDNMDMDDGIYTLTSCFNFQYKILEVKL